MYLTILFIYIKYVEINTLLQATVSFILKHLIHKSLSVHFIIYENMYTFSTLLPRHKWGEGGIICLQILP